MQYFHLVLRLRGHRCSKPSSCKSTQTGGYNYIAKGADRCIGLMSKQGEHLCVSLQNSTGDLHVESGGKCCFEVPPVGIERIKHFQVAMDKNYRLEGLADLAETLHYSGSQVVASFTANVSQSIAVVFHRLIPSLSIWNSYS